MNNKNSLKGRKVIITGGSSGIGRAAAGIFTAHGASVSLVARTRLTLKKAADELSALAASPGQYADFFPLDVSQETGVRDFSRKYNDLHGAPDIIINSAGIAHHPQYFEDMSGDTFRDNMNVNFFGTINMCSAFVPLMKQKGGDIVNISSTGGVAPCYGFTAYCASKYAVTGFTLSLRSEMKKFNINVTLFCPCNTYTPMLDMLEKDRQRENKALTDMVKPMKAEEVALVMLDGMLKKHSVVYTKNYKIFAIMNRLSPSLCEWGADRVVRNA